MIKRRDVWNEWARIWSRQKASHVDELRSCTIRRESFSMILRFLQLNRSLSESLCRRWNLLRWCLFVNWCINQLNLRCKKRKELTTSKISEKRLWRFVCDRWCDQSAWEWCIARRKSFSLKSNRCSRCDVFWDRVAIWDAKHCRRLRLRSAITWSLSFYWLKSSWSSRLCNAEHVSRRCLFFSRSALWAADCALSLHNLNESLWSISLSYLTCWITRWVDKF